MSALVQLRVVGLLEGVSLLVLLFIAMPLKYLGGIPDAVRVVGSLHGLFFLMFLVALFRAASEFDWPPRRYLTVAIVAVVPFGVFWLDRTLKSEEPRIPPE